MGGHGLGAVAESQLASQMLMIPPAFLQSLFQDLKFSLGDVILIWVKSPLSRLAWPLGNIESTFA